MRTHKIVLCIDERWYAALSRRLSDETVEDKLNEYLDELINQLPEPVCKRICSEIYDEESQLERQQQDESGHFSIFHVKENGAESYLQVYCGLEFLDAARLLRSYLRSEHGAASFTQELHNAEEISADLFHRMAELRLENTGEVTGAFELDFDAQTMSALHIMDGWTVYPMKEVSTAVYFAQKKLYSTEDERWRRFQKRLEGKELTEPVEAPQMELGM